jgi:hypothetical protein
VLYDNDRKYNNEDLPTFDSHEIMALAENLFDTMKPSVDWCGLWILNKRLLKHSGYDNAYGGYGYSPAIILTASLK